jgi:hypothetical protein
MNAPTPKAEWALIGDGLHIAANKALLVWNKKTQLPELATVDYSEPEGTNDPRGDLWTEDRGKRLNWDHYCHFCYIGCPKASSADKGVTVFVKNPYSGRWDIMAILESHQIDQAHHAAAHLRELGHQASVTTTGHPPKDTE